MLRAVTFDFWNTLFTDRHGYERDRRRIALLEAELGQAGELPPTAVTWEALRTGLTFFDRIWLEEVRTPDCAEMMDYVLATLDVRLPKAARTRLVEQFERLILDEPPVEPLPGARETLETLTQRYRLAVICDTSYSPGSILRELLERHGMLRCFEYLYFSNEHGRCKPDRRVFTQTLTALNVPAQAAAHVGDIQRTDIAGAQTAGMSAVHFLGANDHDARWSTADARVREFAELPRALEKLPRRRRAWSGLGRLWRNDDL